MTIVSSGPISLGPAAGTNRSISGEFGGSAPFSLSNYYAGGPNVPAGTVGDGGPIPSSGPIAFSDFYGASAFVVSITNDGLITTRTSPTDAFASVRFFTDGRLQVVDGSGTVTKTNQWLVGGAVSNVGDNFQFKFSPSGTVNVDNDDTSTGIPVLDNVFHTLTAANAGNNAFFEVGTERTTIGTSTGSVVVEIRQVGSTTVSDAATFSFNCRVEAAGGGN